MPLALATARAAVQPAGALATPPTDETQFDRILKLIPTDVVTLYTASIPFLTGETWKYARVVALGIGVAFVVLILFLDGRITKQPAPWAQYVVRSVALAAWGIATLWPFWWVEPSDGLRGAIAIAVVAVPVVGERVLKAFE
jgi:hypothetical protein